MQPVLAPLPRLLSISIRVPTLVAYRLLRAGLNSVDRYRGIDAIHEAMEVVFNTAAAVNRI